MQDKDFMNLNLYSHFYSNNIPEISKMQWMCFEKRYPFKLFFKQDITENIFNQMNMKSAITKDLMSLMPYVLPIYHTFHRDLKSGEIIVNQAEIFKNQLDNISDSDKEEI